MCWQTDNKNMSRISVRHCSMCFKSSLKKIQAAGKKIKFHRSSIDQRLGLTDQKLRKIIYAKFKSSPSP